jgi:hypothetical protein
VNTDALFDLVLSGHLSQGVERATAKVQLAQLFKMPVEKVDALLASAPLVLKRDLSWEAAKRFRAAIKQAGALSDIRPSEQTKLACDPAAQTAELDREPQIPAQNIASSGSWDLAPVGGDLLAPTERSAVKSRLDEFEGFTLRQNEGNLLEDGEYAPKVQAPSGIGESLDLMPAGCAVLAEHEKALPVIALVEIPDLQVASLGAVLSTPDTKVINAPDVSHIKLTDQ